jgi:hypothetical protein
MAVYVCNSSVTRGIGRRLHWAKTRDLIRKLKQKKWEGRQGVWLKWVVCLPSKHKALNSNPIQYHKKI